MLDAANSRILVIDDEEVVRDSIRLILVSKPRSHQIADTFAADLFGDLPPVAHSPSKLLNFTVDEASNGEAGVEMVRIALAAGNPYAVVFVDMRMPGWDGMETVQNLRQIDRQAEVVFVTAYSDTSIEEVVERAGPNVGYHLKPFAPEEIKQIATKAVYDWNKLRRLEHLIDLIGTLKVNATELTALLDHVFNQVANWIGTESALLARRKSDGQFEEVLATGSFRQPAVAMECLNRLGAAGGQPDIASDANFICFRLERYNFVALLERSARVNSEKFYLLELFTRHAGQAIENLRLHEALVQGEKLAAVGLAIGKVSHDLRSPIGAIQSAIALIRDSPEDVELLSEMLDIIEKSSDEALSLADEVLSFTRKSAACPTLLAAADLFEAVRERMTDRLSAFGVSLQFESHDVERFVADGSKLQRALLNLVQNAAEALHSSRTAQPCIHVRVSREANNVRIEVADNGPGIPPYVLSKLFEPFTTHGKPGGTGLGLAIVRQAAEAHGGTVDLETTEAGSRFVILLPDLVAQPISQRLAGVLDQPVAVS